jgi:hypothetical protein
MTLNTHLTFKKKEIYHTGPYELVPTKFFPSKKKKKQT